jgi:hypothetical protein
MSESRCPCGAALPEGALACGLCHRPARVAEPGAPDVAGDGQPSPNGFLPAPPRAPRADPRAGYSRTAKGVTSYGPLGRAVATALVLLPPTFFWLVGGAALLVPIVMWLVIAVPLVLRDVWKRERVAAPEWLVARRAQAPQDRGQAL